MEKEYIKISKPSPLPYNTHLLRNLDDEFWKNHIFYHLLSFYAHYDKTKLKEIIDLEQSKNNSRTERVIAKQIRKYLNNNQEFSLNFKAFGENTNDEDVEGNYDITIDNTYWQVSFHFECKNLDISQDLVNKYVCYNTGHSIFDGGVYRYFNKKYAQNQNFGGMLGFVLQGDVQTIKNKIIEKMKLPFNISPEGDFLNIEENAIVGNDFTFNSTHKRKIGEFMLHHLLFKFE
ncbi:hypothetical protein FACS189440_21470 [Bacteroidia bacterium]|nr:hypothetical protein FACS189423_09670 [Bacteroidia bacterium]GHT51928.1 hypothetical protein FACS189440_21470 [Bacteroidia bacterium]